MWQSHDAPRVILCPCCKGCHVPWEFYDGINSGNCGFSNTSLYRQYYFFLCRPPLPSLGNTRLEYIRLNIHTYKYRMVYHRATYMDSWRWEFYLLIALREILTHSSNPQRSSRPLKKELQRRGASFLHGENYMGIFTTLSVVIWLSTGTGDFCHISLCFYYACGNVRHTEYGNNSHTIDFHTVL